MNINDYREKIREFCIYQSGNTGSLQELMYLSLGLSGEAGEVANKIKKLYRDGDGIPQREKIRKELGDALWYWVRLCDALMVNPEDIMWENYNKLADRKARNVIAGDGDSR